MPKANTRSPGRSRRCAVRPVHHAGAQNLQPASVFTDAAAGAPHKDAVHVNLDARLREGKYDLRKRILRPSPLHLVGEIEQRALWVAEGDVVTDGKALRPGRTSSPRRRHIPLVAIAFPGNTARIGSGAYLRMAWIWRGLVCVRRITSGVVVKKVSCISRAGWSAGS